jgi:MSHA biogenesis protein MshL
MKSPLLPLLLLVIAGVADAANDAALPRFDLDVVDVPARALFLGLGARGGVNVLVHPEVKGTLTLSLHNVNVPEVLAAVRDMYGYDSRKTEVGYFVQPAGLRTQYYAINYLDMERSGVSRTLVSSGSITESSHNNGNSAATASSGSGTTTTGSGTAAGGASDQTGTSTGTTIVSSTDADFWSQLESNLRTIIGTGTDRSVFVNRHAGIVGVRAAPEEQRGVADYLQRIQTTITRQVILEAKILEVELNDTYQAGINWAAVFQRGSDTYLGGVTSPPAGFDNSLLNTPGRPITLAPGNPLSALTNATLGSAFTLALDTGNVNAVIDLLKVQGNTRVLSSPRVATLHNQKAVIKAGTDELFVTNVRTNSVTGTATSTSREIELTPFFSGIALDVTPQISADNTVILHVHPSVSEVKDQIKRLTVDGATDELPLAVSEIRESDSVVKARSGQIVIIGGLMRSSVGKQNFGTPFLSSIPGLGQLFKSRRDMTRKTELVILLQPLVTESDGAEAMTQAASGRVNEFESQLKH